MYIHSFTVSWGSVCWSKETHTYLYPVSVCHMEVCVTTVVSLPRPSIINLYTHSPTHSACLCPSLSPSLPLSTTEQTHSVPSKVFDRIVRFGFQLCWNVSFLWLQCSSPLWGTVIIKMATNWKGLVFMNDKHQHLVLHQMINIIIEACFT